jgi:hypothetical protein
MSKETLGIVLAIVVGVMGFAVWIADKYEKAPPTLIVMVLLLMAGLCLCGVYLIPWLWKTPTLAEKIWRVSTATVLVLIAIGYFGVWVSRPHKEQAAVDAAHGRAGQLSLSFLDVPLPVSIGPNTTLYYATISSSAKVPHWGLTSYGNVGTTGSINWHPEGTQDGTSIVRCDIKNDGDRTVISAALIFTFNHALDKVKVADPVPAYTVPLNSVNAGAMFSFYFDNTTPYGLQIGSPDIAHGVISGESRTVDIPIHKTITNPLEKFLNGTWILPPHLDDVKGGRQGAKKKKR